MTKRRRIEDQGGKIEDSTFCSPFFRTASPRKIRKSKSEIGNSNARIWNFGFRISNFGLHISVLATWIDWLDRVERTSPSLELQPPDHHAAGLRRSCRAERYGGSRSQPRASPTLLHSLSRLSAAGH